MIALVVLAYGAIRLFGEGLPAPGGVVVAATSSSHGPSLAHLLLALATVTIAARGVGAAGAKWLGQPPVMGEIVAGIALGPSVLGALAPTVQAFLLPSDVNLAPIANLGVVLFMFLVGLDLDLGLLRRTGHAAAAIAHASIAAPFLLGALGAVVLYTDYAPAGVSFTSFSLFFAVAMSVTAFPVLARILHDRGVTHSSIGATALTCAAVDDATAWTLLATVAGIATSEAGSTLKVVLAVAAYIVGMFVVVRPLVRWLVERAEASDEPLSRGALAAALVGLLLSAAITEAAGIHALFGAFLLGALFPHDGRVAREIRARVEDLVVVLFLPVFFAHTGLRTQIGLLHEARDWLFAGGVIALATLGKVGGSYVAGRVVGLGRREAAAIGILMNTRGLMAFVVLNVGLDLGVITPTVFAMLVVMALVTTFATSPALDLVLGRGREAWFPTEPTEPVAQP